MQKNPNFQHFDYRIDNVNDRVDNTNERIDHSFEALSRQISELSNKVSTNSQWAIGLTISAVIAIIIGTIEIGITLIH